LRKVSQMLGIAENTFSTIEPEIPQSLREEPIKSKINSSFQKEITDGFEVQ